MKKLALMMFLIFGFGLNAQTADEIINKNLENSGGIKNWKNLNSIIMRADAILSLEQSFPMVVYHKRPYQKKVVFLIDGKELLNEGYDGENGWTFNDISGKNEIINTYQPDSFESDILDYKKKGFEAKYLGKSTSEGKECYMVELTKNVNRSTYCFSTENYSTLWEENKDERIYFYDYKEFNGLKFSTRMIGQPKEGGEYVIKINSIQINPNIENRTFNFK